MAHSASTGSRVDACAAANDDDGDYLAQLIREDEAFIRRVNRIFYRCGSDPADATPGWDGGLTS